jgi:hypothetical protein
MHDFSLVENLIHCRALESQPGAPLRHRGASAPAAPAWPDQPGSATTTADSSTTAVTRWRVRRPLLLAAKPTS